MNQNIRASQFILTYGPGAILEGQRGPRIIPDADIGLFAAGSQFNVWDYRIDDDRMSQGLLEGANIFRLPPNAEVGKQGDEYIYRTVSFPTWKLCLNQSNHPNQAYLLYAGIRCPICQDSAMTSQQEAIRFVRACPNGHLDDVPWESIVHKGTDCAMTNIENIPAPIRRSGSFLWHRRGGTLSSIDVECPRCGRHENFGNAYYRSWTCSGRFPEREGISSTPHRPHNCNRRSKIIQRQAANLRISEIRTLLSIKQILTKRHEQLQHPAIKSQIVLHFPKTFDEFEKTLQTLTSANLISKTSMDEILLDIEWDELKKILNDVLNPVPTSYHGLIMDEFRELTEASLHGAPPVRSPRPHSNIIFEINPNFIRTISTENGTNIRITPVQKLRTVTVQVGYRRELSDTENDPLPSKLADVSFDDNASRTWFPGVQFLGEGLFIQIEDGKILNTLSGKHAKKWLNALEKTDDYPDYVFRDGVNSKDELHPGFVWLHTFAHLVVRAIRKEVGYSSASIRERIYFERTEKGAKGGILLYATQPRSEGTMGGLIAMGPNFENILARVYEQIQTCSGDPLCKENEMNDHGYIGASCYGCTMNSETSCEHRNMWLDRNILLENMP